MLENVIHVTKRVPAANFVDMPQSCDCVLGGQQAAAGPRPTHATTQSINISIRRRRHSFSICVVLVFVTRDPACARRPSTGYPVGLGPVDWLAF